MYADESVGSVCEWARVRLPAEHLGMGSLGCPRSATAAATAQPGTSGCTDFGQLRIDSRAMSSGAGEGWSGRYWLQKWHDGSRPV